MEFRVAGVDSLIIYFGDKIDFEVNQKVKKANYIISSKKLDGIIELVPSYTSLFITYDIFKYDFETLYKLLQEILTEEVDIKTPSKLIEIDVYYGDEVALDLQYLCDIKNMSKEEFINIHSSKIYDVYAIGFLPAFAYLGIVDERIAYKRLDNPRKKIPKGSVAIANTQTAIYPLDSPGGWNIIGKTPVDIYSKEYETLSLICINDRIKFNPISKEEFIKKGGSFES